MLATDIKTFDTRKDLLNVKNGIINLRNGKLLKHDSNYKITKLVPIEYKEELIQDVIDNPWKHHPNFNWFMEHCFANNKEYIKFQQQEIGYTLSGETNQQTLCLLEGKGQDGKSTMVRLMELLLGDYAVTTGAETFLQSSFTKSGSEHTENLMRLKGARFVIASELKKTGTLNESLVKQLTGQDKITARGLRRESEQFIFTGKIWLMFNESPEINNSYAMRRRIKRIKYTKQVYTIDHNIEKDLEKELPAILIWAVQGSIEYYKNKRVYIPDNCDVFDTTVTEKHGYDPAAFFKEYVIEDVFGYIKPRKMYEQYKQVSIEKGIPPATEKSFLHQFRRKYTTCTISRESSGKKYNGFSLKKHILTAKKVESTSN
jgi:putative DNA primase/helicase